MIKRITPENYHGLLLKTEMVKAVLRDVDPKIKTRRLSGLQEINADPELWQSNGELYIESPNSGGYAWFHGIGTINKRVKCPYGTPGHILWVKESYAIEGDRYIYKADELFGYEGTKWKSSLLMPFKAARLFLEITDIKVERIQSISEMDCLAEGVGTPFDQLSLDVPFADRRLWYQLNHPTVQFKILWQQIHGDSWLRNEWVWVVSFRNVTNELRNEDYDKLYLEGGLSIVIKDPFPPFQKPLKQ